MDDVQKALKAKYSQLHPLLFQRSLEKAESNVELFEILDSITEYPVVWSETERRWVQTDLFEWKRKGIQS